MPKTDDKNQKKVSCLTTANRPLPKENGVPKKQKISKKSEENISKSEDILLTLIAKIVVEIIIKEEL